ncbi:phage tail protein [Chromobacterium sp. ATCC 53434]|uniref:phage tail protein n=1 Tax=Chromobacterium sp. (strain ATCC 53434 / SC 14030) TaxID=2059672 RepID=UPI00130536FE|nr:phage tail protein [Chromobacterium sp. ATCC 53434]
MKMVADLLSYDGELRPLRPSASHAWNGEAWVVDDALVKQQRERLGAEACDRIDDAADSASRPYAGNELRALEYRRAAAEAQSYKDGGYKGDAPPMVKAWADAKDLSGKDAADGILAKAAAGDQALAAIRALRLAGKEAVRRAADADAVRAAADDALARLRQAAQSSDAQTGSAGDAGGFWRSSLKLFSRGA